MKQFCSSKPLQDLIYAQKCGESVGIYSACSAHPSVLRAVMKETLQSGDILLIESTCNQVNQFGGYTGMTPIDFAQYVQNLADEIGLSTERILLGGDHLGINVWQNEPIESALQKACAMITAYINAGYEKIHIDMSMPAADDKNLPLSTALIAERSAVLCACAEQTAAQCGRKPVYVIGSEVPPPGGAKSGEDELAVTTSEDALDTIAIFRQAFESAGLQDAFSRIIALVVQPGVEFGDMEIHDYCRKKALPLSKMIESVPGMVMEAHSTDYQSAKALNELVQDHFAILKVGPELTFAYREALFALAAMEEIWIGDVLGLPLSNIRQIIDEVMTEKSGYWLKFYGSDLNRQAYSRIFSLSDRIRYYWAEPLIEAATECLRKNLKNHPLPFALLSAYLPMEAQMMREGHIRNDPDDLLEAHIGLVAARYRRACNSVK